MNTKTKAVTLVGGGFFVVAKVVASLCPVPSAQADDAAVPEPTSGLLLLLGVAGLALRRKRA